MDVTTITILTALLAGAISFLSPCCLPLVPGYLAVVAPPGAVGAVGTSEQPPKSVMRIVLFLFGFMSVFVALGLTASAIGRALAVNRDIVSFAAGSALVGMGLLMLRPRGLAFGLMSGPAGSFAGRLGSAGPLLAGAAFAVAWTPCIGPVLAGVLTLAAATGTVASGGVLLAVYAAGLSIPFLLVGLAFNRGYARLRTAARARTAINRVSGVLLIAMGLLVASDRLAMLNIGLQRLAAGWGVEFWRYM